MFGDFQNFNLMKGFPNMPNFGMPPHMTMAPMPGLQSFNPPTNFNSLDSLTTMMNQLEDKIKNPIFPMAMPPPNMIPQAQCEPCAPPLVDLAETNPEFAMTFTAKICYACPFKGSVGCMMEFNKSKHLYTHMQCFHGVPKKDKIPCPHCTKLSSCMANFVAHVRKHTGERPWKCPYVNCKYRTATKHNCKLHVIQSHGKDVYHTFESYFHADRVTALEKLENKKRKRKRTQQDMQNLWSKKMKFDAPGTVMPANFHHGSFFPLPDPNLLQKYHLNRSMTNTQNLIQENQNLINETLVNEEKPVVKKEEKKDHIEVACG